MRRPDASGTPDASAAADASTRVSTRVVVPALGIDLPIVKPPGGASTYPLCDVAMYIQQLSQPGLPGATYLYAHARTGMFLPILTASKVDNGRRMIGMLVQVYTTDDQLYLYEVVQVRRHVTTLDGALAEKRETLWLQTSEGPVGTLEKILLTHGHIDHAGATAQLARQRSLPIEGPHREEAFWIDQLPAQSQRFGFPPSEAFTPDRWLEHGDTVTVGNETLQVLHTPGHTPGHVAFFHAPSRVAIVGDVLFQGSIGRTDFPRGDFDTLVRSIRERLWPLGNDVTFIPGHGPVSTFGRERATNPYVGDSAAPKHL
jgi:glyoxylase-like metal-dependent hydrolase (beta-lactamase superfamily II)